MRRFVTPIAALVGVGRRSELAAAFAVGLVLAVATTVLVAQPRLLRRAETESLDQAVAATPPQWLGLALDMPDLFAFTGDGDPTDAGDRCLRRARRDCPCPALQPVRRRQIRHRHDTVHRPRGGRRTGSFPDHDDAAPPPRPRRPGGVRGGSAAAANRRDDRRPDGGDGDRGERRHRRDARAGRRIRAHHGGLRRRPTASDRRPVATPVPGQGQRRVPSDSSHRPVLVGRPPAPSTHRQRHQRRGRVHRLRDVPARAARHRPVRGRRDHPAPGRADGASWSPAPSTSTTRTTSSKRCGPGSPRETSADSESPQVSARYWSTQPSGGRRRRRPRSSPSWGWSVPPWPRASSSCGSAPPADAPGSRWPGRGEPERRRWWSPPRWRWRWSPRSPERSGCWSVPWPAVGGSARALPRSAWRWCSVSARCWPRPSSSPARHAASGSSRRRRQPKLAGAGHRAGAGGRRRQRDGLPARGGASRRPVEQHPGHTSPRPGPAAPWRWPLDWWYRRWSAGSPDRARVGRGSAGGVATGGQRRRCPLRSRAGGDHRAHRHRAGPGRRSRAHRRHRRGRLACRWEPRCG